MGIRVYYAVLFRATPHSPDANLARKGSQVRSDCSEVLFCIKADEVHWPCRQVSACPNKNALTGLGFAQRKHLLSSKPELRLPLRERLERTWGGRERGRAKDTGGTDIPRGGTQLMRE